MKLMNFWMDKELREELEIYCRATDRDYSSTIRRALKLLFDQERVK